MKCVYHEVDLDGRLSAAIVKMKNPDCELIGTDYHKTFPWKKFQHGSHETVYMVDVSIYPMRLMFELAARCKLIWIDHHITAMKAYAELVHGPDKLEYIKGYRASKKGGACILTFEHLHPRLNVPRAVNLVGQYDVWNLENPATVHFSYGALMHETDPRTEEGLSFWKRVMFDEEFLFEVLIKGEHLQKYENNKNASFIAENAFEVEFEGLKCLATTAMNVNSMLFNSMWGNGEYDAYIVFGFLKDKWKVSLYRAKDDIDVSPIAQKYKGGGHAGAAAFTTPVLPFVLPVKDA